MIRPSHLSLFYLCSIAAIAVDGFHVGGRRAFHLPRSFSIHAESTSGEVPSSDPAPAIEVDQKVVKEPKVDAPTPPAPAAAMAVAVPDSVDPGTMDEGIFKFNKQLIDTVYDIICFLYPVKGN